MKGKRFLLTTVTVILVAVLLVGASPVMAGGKTPEVIAKSNGFPSGMHFNLNIHEHDLSLDDPCTHEAGGNSVFIDEYGTSTIEYRTNKKSSLTELTVTDPCASGDGKVSISLPMKVAVTDEVTLVTENVAVDGYYVYGRILGKPQNGKSDPDGKDRSNILFSPNMVTDAYNLDEEMVELGLITWDATYYPSDEAFYRFDDPTAKGKGKSKAREMTHLFEYTGWVVSDILDTWPVVDGVVGDGFITVEDIPVRDWDGDPLTPDDQNADGINGVDDNDIEAWLTWVNDESLAKHYANEWIFNIADVVTTEGEVVNDGTKLFQIRFYPYFD